MSVLTTTARLTNEFTFDLRGVPDALAVGNLRLTNICLNTELAAHAIDNNIEVQFAHTGDDGLPRFFIGLNAERGIFLCKLGQRQPHLFLIDLRSRLNSNRNNRLRKLHSLEHHRIIRITKRVARGDIFEANRGRNVAGKYFFDFFSAVGVHLNHSTNTLFFTFHRIENRITRFEFAGVNTKESQGPDIRVGRDLKRQGREGFAIVRLAGNNGLAIQLGSFNSLHLGRRWQILNNRVEYGLHAFILEGTPAEDRDYLVSECPGSNTRFNLLLR